MFLASGLTLIAAPAIAQSSSPELRWRLACSYPKSLESITGTLERMTKRLAALTNGRFQIDWYGPGELVPALAVLDAVQNGAVEAGYTGSYFYVGKDPTFAFDTALPFGLTARQQNAWMASGGQALIREFMSGYNIYPIPCGNTGAQMGGWFRKEIGSLDQLKGLKIRIPGMAGEIFLRLGAVPQQIAPGDIYTSLERGTIDAAKFISPYDDERLGLVKVAPFYYFPGWWEGASQGSIYIGLDKWQSLPPQYQAALEAACAESGVWMTAQYDAQNPTALRRLIGQGAQLRPFSRDVMQACYKIAFEIFEQQAAGNPRFDKVYKSWSKFREEEHAWFRIAENTFENFNYSMTRGGGQPK
jgi:TRAP-type mannitol/chloroaromatic compound transport system substrate-binding protein